MQIPSNIPEVLSEGPTRRGVLLKRSRIGGQWKARYFILQKSRVSPWAFKNIPIDQRRFIRPFQVIYGIFSAEDHDPISRTISKSIANPSRTVRQLTATDHGSASHSRTHSPSPQAVSEFPSSGPKSHEFTELGSIQLGDRWSVFDRDSLSGITPPIGFAFELHNPVFSELSYTFDCASAETRSEWIADFRKTIYILELRKYKNLP